MFLKKKLQHYAPRGMTFVEVVVWIGILTLLMAAMVVAIINVYRNNSYTFERALAVISVRRGLETVTQSVREAGYSDSGAYPVVAFGENSFTFYADYDNDGSAEQVRLFLDGEDLNRGVIEATSTPAVYTGGEVVTTIVSNISNITLSRDLFTYYDTTGSEVVDFSAALDPVFVEVDIVANTGKDDSVSDYELHGSAFMRNLKN